MYADVRMKGQLVHQTMASGEGHCVVFVRKTKQCHSQCLSPPWGRTGHQPRRGGEGEITWEQQESHPEREKNIPIFLLDSRHRIRSYVINKLLASVPGERIENKRIIIRRRMLERLS